MEISETYDSMLIEKLKKNHRPRNFIKTFLVCKKKIDFNFKVLFSARQTKCVFTKLFDLVDFSRVSRRKGTTRARVDIVGPVLVATGST